MNGYERISAALKGETPDKSPVMLHNFQMAAHEAGFTMSEYRNDPEKIAKSFIQAVETYMYDGILVDIDTATMAGASGVPVDFPEDEPARVHEPLLPNLENFDFLGSIKAKEYKYIQIWCEAVSIIKNYFKNEIYIRGNCDQAPFSLASMLRTPQEWLMDLIINEEEALKLLEYCTDISIQFIDVMSETGCDMVSNGDSPAGPDMISPDMYEKFALPYEKKVIEYAHKKGVTYTLHICGNTNVILDKMLESGADAVELDYKTDVEKANQAFKDKITFIGNIDPSGVVCMGSIDDVKREVRNVMKVFSDNPRFILNAGCAIPPHTPPENIKAMIALAHS